MRAHTIGYLLKRLILAALTVWVVITVTFFVMRAVPGGPFLGEKALSDEALAALEAKYGMDKPLTEQYFTYLKDIVTRLDFGPSLKQRGRTVAEVIWEGLRISARLGLIAAAIATVSGLILGSAAALRRGKLADRLIMILTTAFVSMPSFIIGTFLLLIFAVKFTLLPANGAMPGGFILPVITLALYPTAYITRLTRSSMLDVLGQDYIRTARAKGVSGRNILYRHALKNAMVPILPMIIGSFISVMSGSMIIERIFSIPGVGQLYIQSIQLFDYDVFMVDCIFYSFVGLLAGIVVDLSYGFIDPRIRMGEK